MKKIFLSLSIMITGAFAMAQQTTTTELKTRDTAGKELKVKRAAVSLEDRLAKMKTDLNLSDAQVTQIKTLHEKNKAERSDKMQAEKSQRDMVMKAKKEKNEADMKQILTAEQYQKWYAQKEAKMQKMQRKTKSVK